MRNIDTGEPLATIRDRILSANAYIGAFPLAEALATGADVVDLRPLRGCRPGARAHDHRFGWGAEDYDKLAAGIVAGHIIECGAQCTGGNCQVDWQNIPDLANIGYPIVEAEPDGSFVVTKHPGTGGRIDSHGVKEQLLYEIGDPRQYMTPDCVADFTSSAWKMPGPDRVHGSGVRGAPRPPMLKASISYHAGWKASGHAGLQLAAGARKGARGGPHHAPAPRATGAAASTKSIREYFGVNACHGSSGAARSHDPPEVQVRISVRGSDKRAVDRFTREMIPLVLTGPPGGTGYGEGRPGGAANRGLLAGLDSARRNPHARGGGRMKVPLSRIAHTRSGDKGDIANIGVIAWHAAILSDPAAGGDAGARESLLRRAGEGRSGPFRAAQSARAELAAAPRPWAAAAPFRCAPTRRAKPWAPRCWRWRSIVDERELTD